MYDEELHLDVMETSEEHFLVKHLGPRSPLVWRGGCGHWPATRSLGASVWKRVTTASSFGLRFYSAMVPLHLRNMYQLRDVGCRCQEVLSVEHLPRRKVHEVRICSLKMVLQ